MVDNNLGSTAAPLDDGEMKEADGVEKQDWRKSSRNEDAEKEGEHYDKSLS